MKILSCVLLGFCLLLTSQFTASALPFTNTTQSVTLAWNPSSDPSVVGYKIYYGVGTRSYTNFVTVGNVTNAVVSGLKNGVTFFFAATAYNALGLESDYSSEVVYTVSGPPSPPSNLRTAFLNMLRDLIVSEKRRNHVIYVDWDGSAEQPRC